MNRTQALARRAEVLSLLEKETNPATRYNMERYIGDLNQLYINKESGE